MNKLADQRIKTLLEAAYELRNREFKSPFSWNDQNASWLKEKVTRAILGMTNTKLGGDIIIGVEENKKGPLILKGLTATQLQNFEDYDGIKGFVDGFSYSATNFDISWGEYQRGKYIVITVQEFYEVPVICKKNGQHKGVLCKNDIYVRSKKAPYSTIRATELELREIIKMAADKEKTELTQRGWVKSSELTAEEFYKKQTRDLE